MMNKIQNNYSNNQTGLQKMVSKIKDIIKLIDNKVMQHFDELEIKILQILFRWMNSYLMREFSLKLIMRLWDHYFSIQNANALCSADHDIKFSSSVNKNNFISD